jgi:serine/threonine protein phosphatase PrpC
VDGQLAVARAFGDKSLKVHLSATPDIKTVTIDDRTDLLILASDGLWKVDTFSHTEIKFRNTHVTVLVKVYLRNLSGNWILGKIVCSVVGSLTCCPIEEDLMFCVSSCKQVMQNQEAVDLVKKIQDPMAAAKQLSSEALNRKSKDDISCIVVRFR